MKMFFSAFLFLEFAAAACCATDLTNAHLDIEKIAHDRHWKQLLVYNSAGKSEITNPEFFLSFEGKSDPNKELLATLVAFSETHPEPDKHAQCRFPGRYLWLSRQLNLSDLGIKPVTCPTYLKFSENGAAESISIIFATGYLGNPASYYGHLLLKINSPVESSETDLENTAVNFGADVPANENMVIYIAKGIFGGYDSSFTHQQYFYHSHIYGESQLRDMWEYRLDLEKKDLDLLIAHLWEVMGADYTYYFFNRNCAYRMGELLELVTNSTLVKSWRPWETPQMVVQKINNLTANGKPLVKEIRYHPSRQSRLYKRYKQLDKKERDQVHHLIKNPTDIESNSLATLELEQQFKILDTLLDYYQFIRKPEDKEKDINNERYRNILSKRYRLPPGDSNQSFLSDNKPHLGRKPSYVSIGISSHKTLGEILNIWLRPAYYDSLDASYGHIKNASLSMAELTLGITDNETFIRQFNIVKIENIRRNFTNLPGDNNSSWYLDVGAEQQELNCSDCLATKARSGYGYATSTFNDQLLIAGFLGGGFLGQSLTSDRLYASGLITINLNINDYWTLRAETEQRHFGGDFKTNIYRAQTRFQLSQQVDTRLYFAKEGEQELGLSIGFYW